MTWKTSMNIFFEGGPGVIKMAYLSYFLLWYNLSKVV
jgi:hypothetical protein